MASEKIDRIRAKRHAATLRGEHMNLYEAREAVEAELGARQSRTIEGYARMGRARPGTRPRNCWIAEAPDVMASGEHLDSILTDLGVPAAGSVADEKQYQRVRITIETFPEPRAPADPVERAYLAGLRLGRRSGG